MTAKIALVTGAGSGVGRAAAVALGEAGYAVALIGRRAAALAQTAAQMPGRTLVLCADITDPAVVQGAFAALMRRFGRLDLLFNNAGMSLPPIPMEEVTFADWQAIVGTNLTGAFLCSQEAFRIMKPQGGGRIINNGSISAHTPRPHSAPYTATKHAMTGLTKALALDGRAFNIACGQIDIGNASTPMTERMARGVPQADGTIRPEPHMTAGNVARAIVYMASLPLDTNVLFMTVMASAMPFVGRG